MAGELVGPEVFRKWQAVINNSKVVERVSELRALETKVFPTLVSKEDWEQYHYLIAEMAQADMFTNFLLDMNHVEPLESDSKENA